MLSSMHCICWHHEHYALFSSSARSSLAPLHELGDAVTLVIFETVISVDDFRINTQHLHDQKRAWHRQPVSKHALKVHKYPLYPLIVLICSIFSTV
jgi:hypothetical protein